MKLFVCASVGSFAYLSYYSQLEDIIVFTRRHLQDVYVDFCSAIGRKPNPNIYELKDIKIGLLQHIQFMQIPRPTHAFFFEDHSDYVLISYQRWLSHRHVHCTLIDRYCLNISLFNVIHAPRLLDRLKLKVRGIDISEISLLQLFNESYGVISERIEPMINFFNWDTVLRPHLSCYSILNSLISASGKDILPILPLHSRILFLDSPSPISSDSDLLIELNKYASVIFVKPHPNEELSQAAISLISNGAILANKNARIPSELFSFSQIKFLITTSESTSLQSFLEASITCISLKRLWPNSDTTFEPNYLSVHYPSNITQLTTLLNQCVDFS